MTRPRREQTFKMPGPSILAKLFQNRFHVLNIIFLSFIKTHTNIFLIFVQFQVFIDFLGVNGFASILTQGTLSHLSHMSQQFPLFLASLAMLWTIIRLQWFGRVNIYDISTPRIILYMNKCVLGHQVELAPVLHYMGVFADPICHKTHAFQQNVA